MEKIVFFRIGWMDKYQGLEEDEISSGGSFVEKEGYGHEIFNFKSYNGKMYGYVKPPGATINIDRIANFPLNNDFIDDVTVIWAASKLTGGVFIVGWYKNAKIYRNYKKRPGEANIFNKDDEFVYIVEADSDDCILLPWDERVLEIKKGKGGMGQSLVWYADKDEHKNFRTIVLEYINQGVNPIKYIKKTSKARQKGKPMQIDPLIRKNIEDCAVKETINFYEKLGYIVNSKEKDNLGWDLEATLGNETFKIEVKGLSGSQVMFELTPNEYKKMEEFKNEYIICVLTNALNPSRKLHRFLYSNKSKMWEDQNDNCLDFQEITSARCSLR